MQVSTVVANSRQVNEKAASLRVAGLFVGPLIVGLIDLFHPLHFVNGKMVMTNVAPPELGWRIALHIIQIPLFGLVGLAAYLLLADQPGMAATIGKVAVALFTVFYAAFDALSGLGTGLLMQYAVDTPAVQTPLSRRQLKISSIILSPSMCRK